MDFFIDFKREMAVKIEDYENHYISGNNLLVVSRTTKKDHSTDDWYVVLTTDIFPLEKIKRFHIQEKTVKYDIVE